MKLSFCGTPLKNDQVFNDADTGKADDEDLQATEPVRLLGRPKPLEKSYRDYLIERFFNHELTQNKATMLREVGFGEDEIQTLIHQNSGKAWDVYEERLNENRIAKWKEQDKHRPHLGLWGYRNRMIEVEDWESAVREEVVIRVKHFVLSNEAEVARLKHEIERFENFERNPAANREPIPQDVQSFVWRRDGGQCVKCGSQERLEFDHMIPVASGGSNTARNLQLLCETCNRAKGASV